MDNLVSGKTISLKLGGLDGNAFALLGAFSHQARREGWSKEEIDTIRNAAMSGNYDNLVCVLMTHCEETESEDEE